MKKINILDCHCPFGIIIIINSIQNLFELSNEVCL